MTTLEAILMRLWAAEMSGSKRAGRVRLQFLELIPNDGKEREIIIEEEFQLLVSQNDDRSGRTTQYE